MSKKKFKYRHFKSHGIKNFNNIKKIKMPKRIKDISDYLLAVSKKHQERYETI